MVLDIFMLRPLLSIIMFARKYAIREKQVKSVSRQFIDENWVDEEFNDYRFVFDRLRVEL